MTIPIFDPIAQLQPIRAEINEAIKRVLDSGQFILGPEVESFESEIATYLDTKYAIGVASGTDALHLSLLACDIGPGDEVITTPFTFFATVEAIVHCGARPVFVDINPVTCNMDHYLLEAAITPKTKAILPVHLYGHPCNMNSIMDIAQKHGLKVVEDCAQSLGAEYSGTKVGSIGDAGCLSFFPSKNLGAYGDGGMVVTNNPVIAERVRSLRKHGAKKAYYHEESGFNSRLDALQAAILRVKLKHLPEWISKRQKVASIYSSALHDIEGLISLPSISEGQAWNYYTIRLSNLDRGNLQMFLTDRGIQTAVYYPLSLHLQVAMKEYGYQIGDFPIAEQAQNEVLSLPMYPELTQNQIDTIAQSIRGFFKVSHV
ncbi:pleiotropic regulatory protein [Dehalogenimonas sp. WBC-2]|nr:pleiotropic regulatory protein [Dehalogenimonas sp. WBC-2]